MSDQPLSWVEPGELCTLRVEYYRSEMLNARCVAVSEELWLDFIKALAMLGLTIEEKELPVPFSVIRNYQRMREVIDAVYSVQGLQWKEGEDFLPVLERLVSEYAELK